MQRDLKHVRIIEVNRNHLRHVGKPIERLVRARLFLVQEVDDRLDLLLIENSAGFVDQELNVAMKEDVARKLRFHQASRSVNNLSQPGDINNPTLVLQIQLCVPEKL